LSYDLAVKMLPYLRLAVSLVSKVRNWPVYLGIRYGFIKQEEVCYELRNGTKVLGRSYALDGTVLNDVWLEESYDPNHFGVAFDWQSCRTIIDVGGNIGTFTLFAAWKAPAARIVALEPEPGNAAMWRKNVALNQLEHRTLLIEAGVGAQEGTAQLHVYDKNSGGHSLFQFTEKSHPIPVKLHTLQHVFEEQHIQTCDFLKLDCEGGEYEALYGLKPDTLQSIRFIAVEYHHFSKDPRHTPEQLRAFLETHGFTVMQPKKSIFFAYRR
jgi:FkbM family methyltransferase